MKRLKLLLVFVLALSLTGCIQKYEMTDEQDDAMAEYMAGLLLDNDKDYNQELVPMEELQTDNSSDATAPEESDTTQAADTSASSSSDENSDANTGETDSQADYSLSELIGASDFDIKYSSFKLTDAYPENLDNTYFSVSANEGYQLLIIKFSIKNKSKKDKRFKLVDTVVNYQLDIDGMSINKPMLTILENDLQYINITIKSGDTSDAVLVYEISDDADTSNMNLIISRDNKSKIIEIK